MSKLSWAVSRIRPSGNWSEKQTKLHKEFVVGGGGEESCFPHWDFAGRIADLGKPQVMVSPLYGASGTHLTHITAAPPKSSKLQDAGVQTGWSN